MHEKNYCKKFGEQSCQVATLVLLMYMCGACVKKSKIIPASPNTFLLSGAWVTTLDKLSWHHSIRWKLAFSYIIVSLAPLVFFYITILIDIENIYISDRQQRLQRAAHMEANLLASENYIENLLHRALMMRVNGEISDRSQRGSYRVMVFDKHFTVVHDTNMVRTGDTMIVPEVVTAILEGYAAGINRDGEVTAVFAAVAIYNAERERVGAVLLAEDAEDIFVSLEEIRRTVLLYTSLAGVIVCVLVFFASQLLIDPLKNILRVVQRMAEGHLHQRITVNSRDEFSQLGIAFNNMNERLEQVDKAREEFVSNVSHELKTPLSSMKVLAESILLQDDIPIETHREFLTDITSEVDRMTIIVNDLLELVKLDRREHGFHASTIELNKLVEDILKRLSPLAEQKRIVLLYDDVRQVTMDADEVKLSLAISNIVENGIKYTPSGGTVKVMVDADHQNAFVTIQDTGIGIPDEEQGKVFNRFYRVDKTRARGTGGTGLGLAISHAAVLLHNGSLRLNSKPDEGSVFVVRLPIRRGVA